MQRTELVRQQIVDRISPFRIVSGANVADGLVQNESEVGLFAKEATIEFDMVVFADASTEVGDDVAIDFDASFENEGFAFASRCNSAGREESDLGERPCPPGRP